MNTPPITCPLCGFKFSKESAPCAHACPLGKTCNLVCCPSCHYEFPEPTNRFAWIKRLLHRPTAPPSTGDAIPLTDLQAGTECELLCLHCNHATRHTTLSVYGLVPGALLTLKQTSPAYIIRVGETELAIEPDIAREILVKPSIKT